MAESGFPRKLDWSQPEERFQVMLFILIHANRCPVACHWVSRGLKSVCGVGGGCEVDKGKGNIYVCGLTSRRERASQRQKC